MGPSPALSFVWVPPGFVFSIVSVLHVVLGAVLLLVGFIALVHEHSSRASIAFFGLTLALSIWLIGVATMLASSSADIALWWARKFTSLGVAFIPTLIYFFVLETRSGPRRGLAIRSICAAVSLSLYVCFAFVDRFIPSVTMYSWGYVPQYSVWTAPLIAYIGVVVALGLATHVRGLQSTHTRLQRRRSRLLIAGFSMSFLGVVDFLCAYGVPVFPFGGVGMIGLVIVAGRVITSYRLSEVPTTTTGLEVMKTMTDGVVVIDLQGIVRYANAAAAEIFGGPAKEMIGRPCSQVAGIEELGRHMAAVLEQGTERFEFQLQAGEGRTVNLAASVVHNQAQEPSSILFVARDVTQHAANEGALRYERNLLRTLIDNLPVAVYVKDDSLRKLIANPLDYQWMREYQPVGELLGKTDAEVFPPDLAESFSADDRIVIDSREPMMNKLEFFVDRGGRKRWALTSKIPLFDESGKIIGIVGTGVNITDRKLAEEALDRLNRKLRAFTKCNQILTRANDELTLVNDVCDIVCDDAGYRMAWVGYAENDEERSVKPIAWAGREDGYLTDAHISWADSERGRGPVGTALRTGQVVSILDLSTDPRTAPWHEGATSRGYRCCIALPLTDGTGKTFGCFTVYGSEPGSFSVDEQQLLVGLAEDLAFGIVSIRSRIEYKHAMDALERERNLFRTLIDILPESIYTKDTQHRKTMSNPVDLHIIGAEAEAEVLGKTDYDLYPADTASRFYADDRLVMETGTPLIDREEFYFDLDGQKRWLLTSKVPLRNTAGEIVGLVGYGKDITDRVAREAKIEEQAQLLDTASDSITVRDMRNRIRYWNKSAERCYGWSAQYAIGHNEDELLHAKRPEEPRTAFQVVLDQGTWQGDLHYVARDGHEILGEARWTLVRDELGNPHSILCVSTDVTERRSIESQLLRAQRLESLGTLAGGIAHDLNNVLTPILMGLETLGPFIEDPNGRQTLTTIVKSAQRGSNVVKQVLGFARGVEGEREEVRLTTILDEAVSIVRETFPKSIDVHFRTPDDLFPVTGDPTQLLQAVMNLCVNARDAMPKGGMLTISMNNVILDEAFARNHIEAKAVSYALIEVEDTGTGVPPELMDRIFEPFFTTKEPGKGTGLGLSTTQSIVRSHGGFMSTYSEVGKGSNFRIYIPAAKERRQAPSNAPARQMPRGNGELILIVDDEEAVRETVASALEQHGYRVLSAEGGQEAIAMCANRATDIKCMITDIMMPNMDGVMTIQAVRKMDPNIKVVAMSGLLSNGNAAEAHGLGVTAFLTKPFTTATLLRTVHELLEAEK